MQWIIAYLAAGISFGILDAIWLRWAGPNFYRSALGDLLAEQFSCDTGDLSRGTALADLGADHEDMIELAWALGEAIGEEIDESELSEDFTIGELWRFVRDKEENAQE